MYLRAITCKTTKEKFSRLVHQKVIIQHSVMAAISSYMACTKFSMSGWIGGKREMRKRNSFSISAQQQQAAEVQEPQEVKVQEEQEVQKEKMKQQGTPLRPVEPQVNVKSKNMSREYGGQWLSSVTRHVRIYAAYIDPVTCEFDQTQMDKLTLILDPTEEFVWNSETCNKVYSYFQELVDHYEVIISGTLLSSHQFLCYKSCFVVESCNS